MRTSLLTLLLTAFSIAPASGQLPTHQLDDFDRADDAVLGTTPTDPASLQWSEKGEAVASGASITAGETVRIESNRAFLQSGGTEGQKSAVVDLSSLSGYPTTLDDASGVMTWAFNLRQSTADPTGFSAGETGAMFVLAASGNDVAGSANAYAVVVGQDASTDPLKIVRFNGGYSAEGDFTEVVAGSDDIGDAYVSVRVTFDPGNKEWTLYAESASGGFPTSDPRTVSTQVGAAVDGNATGDQKKFVGFLLNHGTDTAQSATFDDLYVTDPNSRLPVELAQFDVVAENDAARLQWTTASETNNAGFAVQHRVDGSFERVGFVEGAGTTTQPQTYRFTVSNLTAGTHQFRLKQVDADGTERLSDVRSVTLSPSSLALTPTGPNPAQPGAPATFRLAVPGSQPVTVTLYNTLGQAVQTLHDGRVSATAQTMRVGVNDVPSGMYLLVARTPADRVVQRLTVVR